MRFQILQPAQLMCHVTELMSLRVECSVNSACVTLVACRVRVCPLVEWLLASAYHVCRCGELYMRKICILTMIEEYNILNQATMLSVWICAIG